MDELFEGCLKGHELVFAICWASVPTSLYNKWKPKLIISESPMIRFIEKKEFSRLRVLLFISTSCLSFCYSYLKALIGSVREALSAGKKPEMRPKMAHDTKEMTIHNGLIMNGNDITKATM